jgi:hypothetical protein
MNEILYDKLIYNFFLKLRHLNVKLQIQFNIIFHKSH